MLKVFSKKQNQLGRGQARTNATDNLIRVHPRLCASNFPQFVLVLAALLLAGCATSIAAPAPTETPTPRASPTREIIATRAPSPTLESKIETRTPTPAPKIFSSFDFLQDYLTNRTYPRIIEGKPWFNGSFNIFQYQQERAGVTYWDFWGEEEDWVTSHHMWLDDAAKWQYYKKETLKGATAFILVDRAGPGVMDKLWFTHDTTIWLNGKPATTEIVEWGNLALLGNLRIEVDNQVAYDGAIKDWFSGKAQKLAPELAQIFMWRYREIGSTGNIIPIPYQQRIKVLTYGGAKPKWFMATGITLPNDARVKSYNQNDLRVDEMARLAQNVLAPEKFIEQFARQENFALNIQPRAPATMRFDGAGTLAALQFKIAKRFDARRVALKIRYGDDLAIDLPLVAFFGERDQLSLHRSTPLGIVDAGDAYLFYSNYPMPYQNGIAIELASDSTIPVSARVALSDDIHATQLRVLYHPGEKLKVYGPDYAVQLDGDGKLVGLVLATSDQDFEKIPKIFYPDKPGVEDFEKKPWANGYLEGNLTMVDGAGTTRIYGGHEDWAEGGYYFNKGFTDPTGGSNRPFAGILRYRGDTNGYATLFRYFNDLSALQFKNGLALYFGHGTWKNNFPVRYAATVYYYREIKN
jgi:hypothetical protein